MISHQNSTTVRTRDHLQARMIQLANDFRALKEERRKLANWEESQEFSILGVLELFTTDIRGYAAQAIDNPSPYETLNKAQPIIDNLKSLQFFEISYVADWYFIADEYPTIKQYVDDLDYLRLLVIEFLSKHPVNTPTAA